MNKLLSIIKFGIVSGVGLAIDFALFLLLISLGSAPFAANAISGTCAVTFVYFASVRRIFTYRGDFVIGLFAAYLCYQAAGVTAASLAVAFLSKNYLDPALSKLVILPVTFSANYLFMSLLTRKGQAIAAGAPASRAMDASIDPAD